MIETIGQFNTLTTAAKDKAERLPWEDKDRYFRRVEQVRALACQEEETRSGRSMGYHELPVFTRLGPRSRGPAEELEEFVRRLS
jgi:hypothetical protein